MNASDEDIYYRYDVSKYEVGEKITMRGWSLNGSHGLSPNQVFTAPPNINDLHQRCKPEMAIRGYRSPF